MTQIIITTSFRENRKIYKAGAGAVDVPDTIAVFALKEGFAKPVTESSVASESQSATPKKTGSAKKNKAVSKPA